MDRALFPVETKQPRIDYAQAVEWQIRTAGKNLETGRFFIG